MALSATVKASIHAQQSRTLDLGAGTSTVSAGLTTAFTDGAGLGQCNVLFSDTRTINASANEDLDLAGSLSHDGQSAVFARVKGIIITAASGNTNNVRVTRPASNGVPFLLAAGDGFDIKPGGQFMLMDPTAAGYAVTADTGDLINVANSSSGTPVTYSIIIIGGAS